MPSCTARLPGRPPACPTGCVPRCSYWGGTVGFMPQRVRLMYTGVGGREEWSSCVLCSPHSPCTRRWHAACSAAHAAVHPCTLQPLQSLTSSPALAPTPCPCRSSPTRGRALGRYSTTHTAWERCSCACWSTCTAPSQSTPGQWWGGWAPPPAAVVALARVGLLQGLGGGRRLAQVQAAESLLLPLLMPSLFFCPPLYHPLLLSPLFWLAIPSPPLLRPSSPPSRCRSNADLEEEDAQVKQIAVEMLQQTEVLGGAPPEVGAGRLR